MDIVMSGPPHGGDGSDIEDIADRNEDMPLQEVAGDLETMVSESDDEDGLPLINLRKKRKFNNLQWKQENGSFIFSMKQAPTDRIDAKKLFSQRRPEKIGASEYEIFLFYF